MEALKASGICHSYGAGEARCEVLKDFALTLGAG